MGLSKTERAKLLELRHLRRHLRRHRFVVRQRAATGVELTREELLVLLAADLYDRVLELERDVAGLKATAPGEPGQ